MKNRTAAPSLPASVMQSVPWSFFDGEVFSDPAEFVRRVRQHHADLTEADVTEEDAWDAGEVVLPVGRVRITWFGVQSPDDEEYMDLSVDLASDDGAHFTAGELLFKINNAVAPHLATVDHCYFEGLAISAPPSGDDPPVYQMMQGS